MYAIPVYSASYQDFFSNSDDRGREITCKGHYSLTTDGVKKDEFSGTKWTLKDKYNNSAIIDFSNTDWGWGTFLSLYQCVDINHDGQLEAVVLYGSGGAHCCFNYFIYKKEKSQLKLVKNIFLGNESRLVFKDINNDGIMEILTFNDSLAYFDKLCYACLPRLPLIICQNNNVFTDCSANFPEIIDKEIQATLKDKGSIDDDWKGIALKYLALHIIKGREAEGWRGVKKYYPQTYSWLKKHSEELKKKLSKKEFIKRFSNEINITD